MTHDVSARVGRRDSGECKDLLPESRKRSSQRGARPHGVPHGPRPQQ